MTHKEIYKWFTLYFPQFAEHVDTWYPNGKNSVRVRQKNGHDFVFTYNRPDLWCFETVKNHINRIRKGDK